MIAALTSSFLTSVGPNPAVPDSVTSQAIVQLQSGEPFLSVAIGFSVLLHGRSARFFSPTAAATVNPGLREPRASRRVPGKREGRARHLR
ncbi:hypothetical protein [Streptomyces sp. NPDC059761]|uniref:hypothetical protein n=1 Tax=Streptomyces sp. NPDC059761 TaxID=3346937 RepID=UPI00365477B7